MLNHVMGWIERCRTLETLLWSSSGEEEDKGNRDNGFSNITASEIENFCGGQSVALDDSPDVFNEPGKPSS